MPRKGTFAPARKLIALLAVLSVAVVAPETRGQGLPTKLTDAEFWKLSTDLSEAGGFFRSDNFVGNETSLQHALSEVSRRVRPGGVYLGVAPDQNFTMMIAIKPRMAFIVDIRRQNLVHHLMYKALMELSPTRAQFLALLFGREVPAKLDTLTSVDSLLAALYQQPRNRTQFEKNLTLVREQITKKHGFALTAQDTSSLRYIFDAFFTAGPMITYNYPAGGGGGSRGFPTYADMVSERDETGARQSYLASEQHYRWIREMQLNNLIVPVVGDFAGAKALRSVGQYVRSKGASITTFYTSNVEQYLFQSPDDWHRFYSNIATLPIDSTSTLIRSIPNNNAHFAPVAGWPGSRSTMLTSYLGDIVRAFTAGRVVSYGDVIGLSR